MSDESKTISQPCAECGEPVETTPVYHTECLGHDMPDLDDLDSERVFKESTLQELIDEWREVARQKHPDEQNVFNARCDAWRKAADELEDLINDPSSE